MKISIDMVLDGYKNGVFPMAESRDSDSFFWVDPDIRGIIPLDRFHCSRSLAKKIRSSLYHPQLNTAFDQVIAGCAARSETWISEPLAAIYKDLHKRGAAHSVECWQDKQLIGGLYGVASGGAFFAESKFHIKADASKMALYWLVQHLRHAGFTLLDIQFVTPHLETLGAVKIPRAMYLKNLATALRKRTAFGQEYHAFEGGAEEK
jgi:leucyl/phenylalanyl-tRNA--protein transferase